MRRATGNAQAASRPIQQYHVFLASPQDVKEEREAVRQFFNEFNAAASLAFRIQLDVLGWEDVKEEEALELLLAVVQDPSLDHADTDRNAGDSQTSDPQTLVRYNAARALERLHPGAPRPYFDWASDWGVADWSPTLWAFDGEEWTPWAIRGSHLEERESGKSPRMDIDFARAHGADRRLQRKVCDVLLRTLQSTQDVLLQINCAHALVRWYDYRDEGLDGELDNLIAKATHPHVQENLKKWFKKAAWRLR